MQHHVPLEQEDSEAETASWPLHTQTLMHAISIVKRTQYILAIAIDQTVICGIYFPPSLSIEDLTKELEKVPVNADILLGDFNVTFGRTVRQLQSKRTTPGPSGNICQQQRSHTN